MAKRQPIDTGPDNARRDERGRFVASKKGRGDKGTMAGFFGNVPVLVVVAAALVVITAGAVIASVTLRRGATRFRT